MWQALYDALPNESLIYLGDGKRCPYGSRSREEVLRFTEEAVERLLAEGCKMIVVACNTATAVAGDECTPDRKFSLTACRCIGACGLAPVLTVNEEVYGRLGVDDVAGVIANYNK